VVAGGVFVALPISILPEKVTSPAIMRALMITPANINPLLRGRFSLKSFVRGPSSNAEAGL
jgi:hypothetical protein